MEKATKEKEMMFTVVLYGPSGDRTWYRKCTMISYGRSHISFKNVRGATVHFSGTYIAEEER